MDRHIKLIVPHCTYIRRIFKISFSEAKPCTKEFSSPSGCTIKLFCNLYSIIHFNKYFLLLLRVDSPKKSSFPAFFATSLLINIFSQRNVQTASAEIQNTNIDNFRFFKKGNSICEYEAFLDTYRKMVLKFNKQATFIQRLHNMSDIHTQLVSQIS